MMLEQTECSETLAYKIQTPGSYTEESIQQTKCVFFFLPRLAPCQQVSFYLITYLILTYNVTFSSVRSVGDMGDWFFPLRSEVWKFTDDTGAA
jgi:hypothetical protein